MENKHIVALLDIRSKENVGSIFRISDATAIEKILLIGYTPQPTDRFGRKDTKIAKTALGAEESVKWEHYDSMGEVYKKYMDYKFVSVEQTSDAEKYDEYDYKQNSIFLFGNEVNGIKDSVIEKTDYSIYLPMFGKKESLNVSTTAAIVLYESLKSRAT